LSLLSGALLGFAWFPHGFLPLIFIAFIPLLVVEDVVCRDPKFRSGIVFLCSFLAFLLWNLITTWWLKNASIGGAVMAIGLNSLIMAIFFYAAHTVKRRIGKWGNLILVFSWIAFEFIHLNWSLSWSWLTLGNVFADTPGIIQWYEYTGVLGGSLWILLVNFILFDIYKKRSETKSKLIRKATIFIIVLAFPFVWSVLVLANPAQCKEIPLRTVIVQPNVDPYNEKFFLGYEEQLVKMLKLAETKVDSTTDYVVFPETALTEDIWEERMNESRSIAILNAFIAKYPRLNVVIGASTLKAYRMDEEISESARKFTQQEGYYDVYNTAFQLDSTKKVQVYHKSRLVQGVETMPLQFIFKYFESLAMDMGGTVGSLGTQKERSLLYSSDSLVKVAPVICYESIFGEFVTDYVKKGANLITIITNDGWWGDTPGYMQHLRLGRLRAIENRRWIIRSANTGVSCFISPEGEILDAAGYWTPVAIEGIVSMNHKMTFYTRCGDYIGRIALYTALILLIYSWLIRFRLVKKS
jgi:apolipoprotein N-acyltransferase